MGRTDAPRETPRTGARRTRHAGAVNYEVVVRGELGPVLRAALLPVRATATQEQTVLRARLSRDRDLADLVSVLRSHGVRVASITVLD